MGKHDRVCTHGPDEQQLSFDLLRKLLGTVDQWGKAQTGRDSAQIDRVVMEGLLQAVTAICVSRELSHLGLPAEETQAFFRRMYKGEGLVRAEETDELLRLQARKEVLLATLKRAISGFPEDPSRARDSRPGRNDIDRRPDGGPSSIQTAEVYANHRIHTTLLPSGSWVVSLVQLGSVKESVGTPGAPVLRLRGEYAHEAEAILAAKRYIDQRPDGRAGGP